MKISELISELEVQWSEHGNIDVWVVGGCGCCAADDEPRLDIGTTKDYDEHPGSLYIH